MKGIFVLSKRETPTLERGERREKFNREDFQVVLSFSVVPVLR